MSKENKEVSVPVEEDKEKVYSIYKLTFEGLEGFTIIKILDRLETLEAAIEAGKRFSTLYGKLLSVEESYRPQPRPQFKPKFKPKDNRPRPREDYKPRPKWMDIKEDAPGKWRR